MLSRLLQTMTCVCAPNLISCPHTTPPYYSVHFDQSPCYATQVVDLLCMDEVLPPSLPVSGTMIGTACPLELAAPIPSPLNCSLGITVTPERSLGAWAELAMLLQSASGAPVTNTSDVYVVIKGE